MATKILFRPVISMCIIGFIFLFLYATNILFPIPMEGGLVWVFGFNIVPVVAFIVVIYIVDEFFNRNFNFIGRIIVFALIMLAANSMIFRGLPVPVGLAYTIAAVMIYLLSLIIDRFVISKFGRDSLITNFLWVFLFAFGACAFLGGRPFYESQLYFLSFMQDRKFIIIMLVWSIFICFRTRFFSRSLLEYFVPLLVMALISSVLVHPIMKAAAFYVIVVFTLLADYVLRTRTQSVG